MIRTAILFLLLAYTCPSLRAQSLVWVNQIGGPGDGDGHAVKVAPNGNVYVAGSFSSTIDLDPSPGVYNITSNGKRDVFLAAYTATGNFLWGFGIGGSDNDYAKNIAIDKNNNAIVVGQFRGTAVDFNPGAGIKLLNANGYVDGFVAVYNVTGGFMWANAIGGTGDYDDAQSATSDASGSIYVGGDFHRIMDIDPNPAVNKYLNSLDGTAFLIKYTPTGQVTWGFSFGGGGNNGIDNTVWGLTTDNNFLYLTGCYQGDNADFDPTAASAVLSASGSYDGYMAKYDLSGALQYVKDIKGSATDQGIDITLDANKNIYIIGYSESVSLNFSSAVTEARPVGSSEANVFIARYNNNGQLQWGHMIGGKGTDFGWGAVVANNNLYCTGYFQNTVDFDPSASTGNMSSAGENDIFMARYDLDGNYICSFNVGAKQHDNAYKIAADNSGYLYLAGFFSASVGFTPFTNANPLISQGGSDIYLAKYNWSGMPAAPNGYFVGDTVCEGDEAYLKFVATSGEGPFIITYSDGTQVYTENNVESGQGVHLSPKPSKTTTYLLTSIKTMAPCSPAGTPNKAVSVLVHPKPEANAGADTSVCPGAEIQLHGAGGITYQWLPATGLSDAYVPDPMITIYNDVVYSLAVTNEFGCNDTDAITISLVRADFKVRERNDVCIGDTLQLQASGGDTYEWLLPADSLYPLNIAMPFTWTQQSRSYRVLIRDTLCGRFDTLEAKVDVHPLPDVRIVTAKDVDCGLRHGQLAANGALRYIWSPGNTLMDSTAQATFAVPVENTWYTVTGTDNWGCSNTDTALIKVFDGMGRLFTADAFTPNGDGLNDCFHINIPGEVSNFELIVVNRWGQVVFHSHNISDCWDGSFNGTVAELGTYGYSYKAVSSICDNLRGKGTVQLVR